MPEEFPDAELFKITTETMADSTVADEDKWLTDMHKFLSTGLPLEEMNRDERKLLAV